MTLVSQLCVLFIQSSNFYELLPFNLCKLKKIKGIDVSLYLDLQGNADYQLHAGPTELLKVVNQTIKVCGRFALVRPTLKDISVRPLNFLFGKDYSGTKFFYTEPISLNKVHSTK